MASIKVILKNKPNAQGQYPLALQIIKNRKPALRFTGIYLLKSEWDDKNKRIKRSHPNAKRMNNLLASKIAEMSEKFLEIETKNANVQASDVVQSFKQSKNKPTFFDAAGQYIENLEKTGQYTRHTSDKSKIKNFKEFLKNSDIHFDEINVSLLKRFASFLMSKKNVGERTVMNHYVVFRTIFNQAIADGIMDKEFYPFGRGKIIIKFPESLKIGLNREEVATLEHCNFPHGYSVSHARNAWLLSFYFAGMRASDVIGLEWSDVMDGRLYDQMDKNSKVGSFKIPQQAMDIINQYEYRRKKGMKHIFPFLDNVNDKDPKDLRRKITNGIGLCNKYLKRLAKTLQMDKPLTMHIARHTFGNISGDKIPVQMLQKLYRHSSITTTIGYQANFMFKDTDEALEAVLG